MRFGVTLCGGTDSKDGHQNVFFLSFGKSWTGLELFAESSSEKWSS